MPLESFEPVPLGPVEGIFWRLEKAAVGLFRATVVVRLDGCIETEYLAAALRQVQRRHPKLRALIATGKDGSPRYEFKPSVPPIPFEIKDYDEGEPRWREEALRLMQNNFPAVGPLAAVSVLRSRSRRCSELLLSVHHAIVDGLSAITLLNDLLTEYANAEAPCEPSLRQSLAPVVARRAKHPAGWRGRFRLLRRMMRNQGHDGSSRQTELPETLGIPPLSQWVHWVYSREETLELVRRCRSQQTSLGAALMAAVFCGIMDCLPAREALLKCQIPFDIRDTLEGPLGPIAKEDLGCFASIMNEFYELRRQPSFWDLARRAHQNQQAFVKNGGPSFYFNLASAIPLLEKVTILRRLFARAASKPAPPSKRVTLLATYYGVVNMRNTYGSLHPRECTLMFKNAEVGPSILMEALVMGQRLNIGFVGDSLEPVFWERLQVAVRRRLDAAISAAETAGQDEVGVQRMSVAPHE